MIEVELKSIQEFLPPYSHWADPEKKLSVSFFPKSPQFKFSILLVALVGIAPLVFLYDSWQRSRNGKIADSGDQAAFLIVIVPIMIAAFWYVLKEWRLNLAQKNGKLRVGFFIDATGLVWCPRIGFGCVLLKAELFALDLNFAYLHRSPCVPKELIFKTHDGRVLVVPSANDYDVSGLLKALKEYFPKLVVTIPSELEKYFQKRKREELMITQRQVVAGKNMPKPAEIGSPGNKKAFVPEKLPAGENGVGYFMSLLQTAEIGIVKIQEFSSVGSSLMSIETPDIWKMERPLMVKLSKLWPIYDDLGPRDQNWLDSIRTKANGCDVDVTVEKLAFSSYVDFQV